MYATRKLFWIIAALVLTTCSSLPRQPAEILPIATVRYYDIDGATTYDLRKDLNAKGPKEGGRGFDAYTKWYFRWNWPGYGTSECNLSAAVVRADVQVTFPRWQGVATAEPKLRKRWLLYIDALANHENGHVELAAGQREKILLAIRSSTCATADQLARQALQSLSAADVEYDRRTRHGHRDGAAFP